MCLLLECSGWWKVTEKLFLAGIFENWLIDRMFCRGIYRACLRISFKFGSLDSLGSLQHTVNITFRPCAASSIGLFYSGF